MSLASLQREQYFFPKKYWMLDTAKIVSHRYFWLILLMEALNISDPLKFDYPFQRTLPYLVAILFRFIDLKCRKFWAACRDYILDTPFFAVFSVLKTKSVSHVTLYSFDPSCKGHSQILVHYMFPFYIQFVIEKRQNTLEFKMQNV